MIIIKDDGSGRMLHDRPVGAYRPCYCGCDYRDKANIGKPGYISGIKGGLGFTVWLDTEEEFQAAAAVLNAE